MKEEEFANRLTTEWTETKKSLTDFDVKYLGNKLNRTGKMIGRFTSRYHKRDRLIKESFITTGYVIKMWQNDLMSKRGVYMTWVLFSPSMLAIYDNNFFEELLNKILELKDKKKKTLKEKRLFNIIDNTISDCEYLDINQFIADLKYPVYLSTCYMFTNLNMSPQLGFNLILYNKKISKEIVYLANDYFPKSYLEFLKIKENKNG